MEITYMFSKTIRITRKVEHESLFWTKSVFYLVRVPAFGMHLFMSVIEDLKAGLGN